MKKISLLVSNETYQQLMQNGGRRTAGRIWLECDGSTRPEFTFESYSHRQRRKDQLLLTSEHGWLKKSAKRYKLHLSVPDILGELRCAHIMKRESKAIIDFVRGLDQLLSNV